MDKEPTDNTTSDEILRVADTPQELSEESDHALGNLEALPTEPVETADAPEAINSSADADVDVVTGDVEESVETELKDGGVAQGEVVSESFMSDPVSQMEREAEIAESDAKDIARLHKIAESGRSLPVAPDESKSESDQPVDVRQDFIDQMHAPKPKPKSNAGKKIAIVTLAVLAVSLVGFFVWWFAYYNQPKKVLADALGGLVSADSVNIDANIATMREDHNGTNTLTNLAFNGQIHGLTEFSGHLGASLGQATIDDEDEEDEEYYDESASGTGMVADLVMLDNGTIYAKLDGLGALEIEYDPEEEDDKNAALDSSITFDKINGKWYQLGVEEVLEFWGLDQDTARPVADFYHCTVAVAGQDYSRELKELYQNFPFLDATKSKAESSTAGTTVYDLAIDYEALANFINALPNLGIMESFYVCYNTMADSLKLNQLSSESFDEVSADELAEIFSETSYTLQAEISNFGHELVRFSAYESDNPDEYSMVMDFDYTYQELSAPEEYWTAEDLVEVMKDYSTVFLNQITSDGINRDNTDDEIEENQWYDDSGWYLGEDLYEDEDEE